MLIEIKCDKFNYEKIEFNNGLNVVLGDNRATNSIGKSALLMIIDFVFGGQSFLEYDKSIIKKLGAHEYLFSFKFNSKQIYFKRKTNNSKYVYKCNEKYEELTGIEIKEYREFLKKSYKIDNSDLTFRSFISTFSRVWGKENLDVERPLHSAKNIKPSECINNILKIYNEYKTIKELLEYIKTKEDEKEAFKKAFDSKIISKISKSQYKERLNQLSEIQKETNEIQENLAKYAVSVKEILSKEMLELKDEKNNLILAKTNTSNRLERVKSDLSGNTHRRIAQYEKLIEFFPEINVEQINKIEEFHSKISKILDKELRKSENELSIILELINKEIKAIDKKFENIIEKPDIAEAIINRIQKLSENNVNISAEIKNFEINERIKKELSKKREYLKEKKLLSLQKIEDLINKKINEYANKIYGEERQSPILELKEKNYNFETLQDTGTGKSYADLIIFDLVFLKETKLPFLIHDSILFKNVEIETISNIIKLYSIMNKQIFIAIDEIEKYGEKTEHILKESSVVALSDEKVLYTKDWRNDS